MISITTGISAVSVHCQVSFLPTGETYTSMTNGVEGLSYLKDGLPVSKSWTDARLAMSRTALIMSDLVIGAIRISPPTSCLYGPRNSFFSIFLGLKSVNTQVGVFRLFSTPKGLAIFSKYDFCCARSIKRINCLRKFSGLQRANPLRNVCVGGRNVSLLSCSHLRRTENDERAFFATILLGCPDIRELAPYPVLPMEPRNVTGKLRPASEWTVLTPPSTLASARNLSKVWGSSCIETRRNTHEYLE